jgi:small ubiquitin-related modifier
MRVDASCDLTLQAYCSKKGVEPGSFRFVFNGERINPQAWPGLVDMVDDDMIDAFAEQLGGMA